MVELRGHNNIKFAKLTRVFKHIILVSLNKRVHYKLITLINIIYNEYICTPKPIIEKISFGDRNLLTKKKNVNKIQLLNKKKLTHFL